MLAHRQLTLVIKEQLNAATMRRMNILRVAREEVRLCLGHLPRHLLRRWRNRQMPYWIIIRWRSLPWIMGNTITWWARRTHQPSGWRANPLSLGQARACQRIIKILQGLGAFKPAKLQLSIIAWNSHHRYPRMPRVLWCQRVREATWAGARRLAERSIFNIVPSMIRITSLQIPINAN